ncbi:uncharacterized protein N7483_003079 [Penicillium malachiteum]|uniref:uncharacterized protein n=1 Tax=Penicillium malachiteum TaxID=1324776 RepID=UPI002548BB36|nr:uncharacterized protein N7483_003079 [Penicillium malachiteum]KAJ5728571.1 hypothetical protein N7483_003079 [Penicillium malachiteum]
MSCHICHSTHSRSPFLCSTCARNRLYQLRLEHTQILLEKESLGRQIELAVASNGPHTQHSQVEETPSQGAGDSSRFWELQTISNKEACATIRVEAVSQHLTKLKDEIEAKKIDIAKRKERLARRRSDAESAQYQLGEREGTILTGIQNTAKRTEHLWHNLHIKTAESRIYLCREAAHLYGLRPKTARRGDTRPTYVLGGLQILDLRDMNGSTPAHISTSLSNIARLLVLVSHYLSLRLPAEIALPNQTNPNPTIYMPAASYNTGQPTGAGLSSTPAAPRSAHSQPRPRPLFIDKTLPRLAKEDPATYGLFLEGATLLAWDVAWLCRTQGLNVTSESWEEVCDIGNSMWQLLGASPAQPSTLMRAFAGRDTQAKIKPAKDTPQTTIHRTKSFPMIGHYSHGTVHSFLGASEGSEFMRTWKLPTPTKITDKLKSNLLGEMASAEWELLEEQEWDDEALQANNPAPSQEAKSSSGTGLSGTNGKTSDQTSDPRPKRTSGWTKLHSR